jgi:hypothetical protein
MPGFDDRLRRDLKRLAEPADPVGAFEGVTQRKMRRRTLRRVQVASLIVVVLAGTIAGTFALSRVFRGRGAVTPGGSPSSTQPSATSPSPTTYPPECEATQVTGDFEGDGVPDLVTVGRNGCIPRPGPMTETNFVLNVEWSPSGEGAITPLAQCQSACAAFAAGDLNGDGIDELILLVDTGASTQFVQVLELPPFPQGQTLGASSTVLPPGAPEYPAGDPAKFALGGSVTHLDFLMCQTADATHHVVATSAALSDDQTVYDIHETVFTFAPVSEPPLGTFAVVSTRDYTAPFDPSGQTQFQPAGTQCVPSGQGGAIGLVPSASPTTVVLWAYSWFDPPGDAQPKLTSTEALAIFKAMYPEFQPPEEPTAQLGFYTAPVGDHRVRDRLAWGYRWHECAASAHPLPPGTVVPCTSWLFLDANTGEMLDLTWQQGT